MIESSVTAESQKPTYMAIYSYLEKLQSDFILIDKYVVATIVNISYCQDARCIIKITHLKIRSLWWDRSQLYHSSHRISLLLTLDLCNKDILLLL